MHTLLAAAAERFGGVDRFTRVWTEHLWKLVVELPGSAASLRAVNAVHRLQEIHEAAGKRELERLSDAELAHEFSTEVELYIERHPAVAVQALVSRGWKLRPPDGVACASPSVVGS